MYTLGNTTQSALDAKTANYYCTMFVSFTENCKATFGQLHFDVRVCDSTKSDKIITYLKKIANMNHTKYDCFILYISSHGGQGYMCCSDYCSSNTNEYGREDKQASGYIYIDTLVETFMSKKCKTLKDKPKLFYFDCCRNHGSKSK